MSDWTKPRFGVWMHKPSGARIEKMDHPTSIRTWYLDFKSSDICFAATKSGTANGGFFKLSAAKAAVEKAWSTNRPKSYWIALGRNRGQIVAILDPQLVGAAEGEHPLAGLIKVRLDSSDGSWVVQGRRNARERWMTLDTGKSQALLPDVETVSALRLRILFRTR